MTWVAARATVQYGCAGSSTRAWTSLHAGLAPSTQSAGGGSAICRSPPGSSAAIVAIVAGTTKGDRTARGISGDRGTAHRRRKPETARSGGGGPRSWRLEGRYDAIAASFGRDAAYA